MKWRTKNLIFPAKAKNCNFVGRSTKNTYWTTFSKHTLQPSSKHPNSGRSNPNKETFSRHADPSRQAYLETPSSYHQFNCSGRSFSVYCCRKPAKERHVDASYCHHWSTRSESRTAGLNLETRNYYLLNLHHCPTNEK